MSFVVILVYLRTILLIFSCEIFPVYAWWFWKNRQERKLPALFMPLGIAIVFNAVFNSQMLRFFMVDPRHYDWAFLISQSLFDVEYSLGAITLLWPLWVINFGFSRRGCVANLAIRLLIGIPLAYVRMRIG